MVLRCPEDKYLFIRDRIVALASCPSLTLEDVRWLAGILAWLSEGVAAGVPYVAPFVAMSAVLERECTRRNSPAGGVSRRTTAHATEALSFWARFLPSWTRLCPMVAGFGPFDVPDVRGWVDTSTVHKRVGGVFYCPGTRTLLGFTRPLSATDCASGAGSLADVSAVFELVGIRVWMRLFHARCARLRLLLETDSEAAMLALAKAFSVKAGMLDPVRDVWALAARQYTRLRIRATPRSFPTMVMADHLSRGDFQAARCIAAQVFDLRLLSV